MAELTPYEVVMYYYEALRSHAPPGEEGNINAEKPRVRILLTLLQDGPQTLSQLMDKTAIIASEFQPTYRDLVQKQIISGPQWTDEVKLTNIGEQFAEMLQEQP